MTILILSSSTSVYGNPSELPVNEETVCKPVSPYAASRLAIEQLLPWYEHAYDLRYLSLRYGTVSGASKHIGESRLSLRLIPQILNVAEGKAEHVAIFGEDYPTPDGSCIRDYLHVLDAAEAHVIAIDALGTSGLGSRTYNLGTGSGYSVHEVVEMARQVTGRKIPTERGARRAGDAAIMISSADRIMGELGWQPRNSDLERIIESSWRWRLASLGER